MKIYGAFAANKSFSDAEQAVIAQLANAKVQVGPWPKIGVAMHLEPGVVQYNEIDHPKTGKKGVMLLLKKDAIDFMRNSFGGKPLVRNHRDVVPDEFKKGTFDGAVVESFWNGETGQEMVRYLVWDPATKLECAKGSGVSCAYIPNKIDWTPGTWHNVNYDGVILEGEYEHLAVVPNPRYEDSKTTLMNAKGDTPTMSLKLWLKEKLGLENSVDVDGGQTLVDVDGVKVPLDKLVNAHKDEEAKKAKAIENAKAAPSDDSSIEVDGKKITIAELKASFKAANAKPESKDDEDEDDAEKKEKKAKAENAKPDEASKAEAKKQEEHFQALKNAAGLRDNGVAESFSMPHSESEQLKRGQELFGSAKA